MDLYPNDASILISEKEIFDSGLLVQGSLGKINKTIVLMNHTSRQLFWPDTL